MVGVAQMVPGDIFPGQRMAIGVRIPPSQVMPLWPRKSRLLAPTKVWPPLSEIKTTRVFSSCPEALMAASNLPIASSNEIISPANFRRPSLSDSGTRDITASFGCSGPWGALNAAYRNQGLLLLRLIKSTPASPRASVRWPSFSTGLPSISNPLPIPLPLPL